MASGAAGLIPSINWVNGIAFTFAPFPETQEVVRDKLKGILHYAVVRFALVPKYQQVVTTIVDNRRFEIRLNKAEKNQNFIEIAKFLKKQDLNMM